MILTAITPSEEPTTAGISDVQPQHQPQQRQRRQKNTIQSTKPKKPGDRRHGARNNNRHQQFVLWLRDTFDCLKEQQPFSDTTILDVAGGKGELSLRLAMCHHYHTVMVDPRPADFVSCYEKTILPKLPMKWKRKMQDHLATNPAFLKETIDERIQQLVTHFDVSTFLPGEENTTTTSSSFTEDLHQAVEKASLLLGLHADGATEAVVQVALHYNKPFCVVPCCVFPNLFSQRRVWDATVQKEVTVRSHDQFCRYLLAMDPRFRMDVLPFEGANVAIWWDGKD